MPEELFSEGEHRCGEGRLVWTMKPECTFRTEYCSRSAFRRSPKDGSWMCQYHFELLSKSLELGLEWD